MLVCAQRQEPFTQAPGLCPVDCDDLAGTCVGGRQHGLAPSLHNAETRRIIQHDPGPNYASRIEDTVLYL